MSFDSLGLAPALVRALAERNYTAPTPIQAEAIPHVLNGHDLLGGAQTGTGKTAAFVLPMLQRLHESPGKGDRRPRALILVPTRELAAQVHDSIRNYSKYQRTTTAVIYGGAGMQPQVDALRRGVDILVATPGRLIDHLERRSADLSGISMLILDEADRMLDMGFLPAIKRILNKVPSQRQTLLFSATFEDELKKLAMEFMRSPKEVQIAARNTIVSTVSHIVHPVDQARKRDLLVDILSKRWQEQILVFGKTKHGCNRLSELLEKAGISSTAIHGNKSQSQRLRALADFKSGAKRVLVATDVAARGLDIPQLPLVINFDLPMVAEDYIHRIGRTGRAGATGEAISLVCQEEGLLLRAILRMLKVEIDMVEVEGYTPQKTIRLGNESPGTGRPAGNRAPRRGEAPRSDAPRGARRPHVNAPRHAHAGPKTHGGAGDAPRRTGGGRG
jgi:ATP-dependent RNA helicase RhlE